MSGNDPTTVYTDGACSGNPGPGGWAWAVDNGPYASGAAAHTTNQRMEITAALDAVRSLDGLVEVVSDSTYVVNCFRQRWWQGWMARGWRNAKKEPVANRDLWEPFVELVRGRGDVTFRWVKGHSGDRMNDTVDGLAVDAMRRQQGRRGDALTPSLVRSMSLEADVVAKPEKADRISGHIVVVTGHRPPELGGYGPNAVAERVLAKLVEILEAKATLVDDLVVATGLGLGAEQLGADAAAEVGIPYVAVLPYPDADSLWPEKSQRRFRELLDDAQREIVLGRKPPETRQEAGKALGARDQWLIDHADEAIIVWDRSDDRLAALVKKYENTLGEEVWIVDPTELR